MFMRFLALCSLSLVILLSSANAQIPTSSPVDFNIYYGKGWGVSGIAESLIDASLAFNFTQETLNSTLTKSIEYITSNRYSFNGVHYFAWEKGPKQETGIYPGIKYGAAGIIDLYVSAYQYFDEPKYLEYAINSFNQLMLSSQGSLPHWGYNFPSPNNASGISLTGYEFGAAGMINAALSLYQTTLNASFLETAFRIADWIYSVSHFPTSDTMAVPWYSHVPGFQSVEIFEFDRGMAGIASVLTDLAIASGNKTIETMAKNIANYLVNSQNEDGSWFQQNDTDVTPLTFSTGTAGIIYSLTKINEAYPSTNYEESITKGVSFLLSHLSNNKFVDDNGQSLSSSFSEGALGVLYSLFKAQKFLTSQQQTILNDLLNQYANSFFLILQNNGQQYLFLKIDEKTVSRVDLSLRNGLAGFLHFSTELKNNLKNFGDYQVDNLVKWSINSLNMVQNLNGSWNRQVSPPSGFSTIQGTVDDSPAFYISAIAFLIIVPRKIKNRAN